MTIVWSFHADTILHISVNACLFVYFCF